MLFGYSYQSNPTNKHPLFLSIDDFSPRSPISKDFQLHSSRNVASIDNKLLHHIQIRRPNTAPSARVQKILSFKVNCLKIHLPYKFYTKN